MAKKSTLVVVKRSTPRDRVEANASSTVPFHALREPAVATAPTTRSATSAGAATSVNNATSPSARTSSTAKTSLPVYIKAILLLTSLLGIIAFTLWVVITKYHLMGNSNDFDTHPSSAPSKPFESQSPYTSVEELTIALRSGLLDVKGVNLGGWLVVEHSMTWDSILWDGVPTEIAQQGEYQTMKFLGHEQGDQRFQDHRKSWITEQDIRQIASYGLNTVRVPVGFWIIGFDTELATNPDQWKVYAPGGLEYLDVLINEWSPKYHVAVMLSLHAHKGSQNGKADSGPAFLGQQEWDSKPENMENSLLFAKFLAERYRTSDGFLGMSLMNEPTQPINMTKVQDYYTSAYQAIRGTGNNCVLGVSPLVTQQNGTSMEDFMLHPEYHNVWQEWHPRFDQEGQDESTVMSAVNSYASNLSSWNGDWLFVSEWNLNSPSSAPFNDTSTKRQFALAQTRVYRYAHSGWTFWSWRHADESRSNSTPMSMRQNLRNGVLGPFTGS